MAGNFIKILIFYDIHNHMEYKIDQMDLSNERKEIFL